MVEAADAIDLIGPELDGLCKYMSAVAVSDFVYAVPWRAKQVLCMNSNTGEVKYIGPKLDRDHAYPPSRLYRWAVTVHD
eukprot:2626739-Amphidinium_carterae.1